MRPVHRAGGAWPRLVAPCQSFPITTTVDEPMIDEPMDLSDQRSDQRPGSPIVVAGSVRGTGHDEEGGLCEDAFTYETFDTPQQSGVAFAVADGAGSASRAATGAEASTQSVVSALVEGATRQHGPVDDDTWKKILEGALLRARTELVLLSWTLGVDTSAFAATMLAGALLEDGRLAYAQVGDGAIVAKRADAKRKVAARPEDSREESDGAHPPREHPTGEQSAEATSAKGTSAEATPAAGHDEDSSSLVVVTERQGKYANEMIPLSAPESRKHWQIGISEEPVAGVAAFTDGLTHMALDLKAGEPRDSFLGELFRTNARLVAKEGVEKANAGLRAYLGSNEIQNRTRDDVTLLTAIRHSEVSNSEFEEPGTEDSAHVGSEEETGPSRSEPPSEESTDSPGESASWTAEILPGSVRRITDPVRRAFK